jgi:hypothetical protein
MITLTTRKEEAKRILQMHLFRDYNDGSAERTAIQQRLHERKALCALLHVKGVHTAELLTAEAAIRGMTTTQLAQDILLKSEQLNQLEIRRMELNGEVDACTKVSDIGKLFIDRQIPVPPGVVYFDEEPTYVNAST